MKHVHIIFSFSSGRTSFSPKSNYTKEAISFNVLSFPYGTVLSISPKQHVTYNYLSKRLPTRESFKRMLLG